MHAAQQSKIKSVSDVLKPIAGGTSHVGNIACGDLPNKNEKTTACTALADEW